MKISNHAVLNALVLLFALSLALALLDMLRFSAGLEQASASIGPRDLEEAAPVFTRHYLTQGAALIAGLLALVMSLVRLQQEKLRQKVVYVEKTVTDEESIREQAGDTLAVEEVLGQLREALARVGDPAKKNQKLLSAVCQHTGAGQGLLYQAIRNKDRRVLVPEASFAFHLPDHSELLYEFGEGLAGQAAMDGRVHYIGEVPEGYHRIVSGLGGTSPRALLLVPVRKGNEVVALAEIAVLGELGQSQRDFAEAALQMYEEHSGGGVKAAGRPVARGRKAMAGAGESRG
jgi:hypothetical protein